MVYIESSSLLILLEETLSLLSILDDFRILFHYDFSTLEFTDISAKSLLLLLIGDDNSSAKSFTSRLHDLAQNRFFFVGV